MFYKYLSLSILIHGFLFGALYFVLHPGFLSELTTPNSLSENYTVSIGHTRSRSESATTHPAVSEKSARSSIVTKGGSNGNSSPAESAGPDTSVSGEENAAANAYLLALTRKINENKTYPRVSMLKGETGEVKVGFVIESDGHFENIRVLEGSRFETLNEAALNAVQRAARATPIPDSLHRTKWEISVPIRFQTH